MDYNIVTEYQKRVNRAIHYIELNYREKITLQELADYCGFSAWHFHRIFRGYTGETLAGFLTRIRLEKSAGMLRYNPDKSITDIALANGFNSSQYFAKIFTKTYGIAPSVFRKNEGLDISLKKERAGYDFSGYSESECVTEYLDDIPVIFLYNTVNYDIPTIGNAWNELLSAAFRYNLFGKNTKMIGVSFDNPEFSDKEKTRYYACIAPENKKYDTNLFGSYTISGGKYICADFYDLPANVGHFYDFLFTVVLPRLEKYPADKPAFDICLNNPNIDPEGKLKMKICIPVENQ